MRAAPAGLAGASIGGVPPENGGGRHPLWDGAVVTGVTASSGVASYPVQRAGSATDGPAVPDWLIASWTPWSSIA